MQECTNEEIIEYIKQELSPKIKYVPWSLELHYQLVTHVMNRSFNKLDYNTASLLIKNAIY